MPVMSGPEFLRRLRLEPGGGEPRVIFCSAETEVARIREALEQGADEFIMKPFDAEIVVGKLAAAGVA
jgi:two-component system chemotaxis response regulator CheY